MRAPIVTVCALLITFATVSTAQERPDTAASLKALEVTKHIRVHKEGTDIRFTLDDDLEDKSGETLQKGQVFVTKRVLKVTYQEFNPLQTVVSVKVKAVENATASTLAKLIEAIAGVGGIIKPSAPGGATDAVSMLLQRTGRTDSKPTIACQAEIKKALSSVKALDDTLFDNVVSSDNIKAEHKKWADAITQAFGAGKNGQTAMQDGASAVRSYGNELKLKLDAAAAEIALIDKAAVETPGDPCRELAVAIYQFIRITNPHARLTQLRGLQKAVTDLEKKLTEMSATGQWIGRDYVAAKDITVTEQMDADVTVEVSDLTVEPGDGSLSVKQGEAVSTPFTVQMDTGWVLEPSVGLTTGYVTRPKFGTTTTDGKTVVGKLDDDRVSVDPAVMVNFISRKGTALLRPMVQLGAATSKESPALFFGVGWRLFGAKKTGLAFGGGLMLAWVKDLATLKPGDEVTGTKDIEADLKFDWARPKPRLYWSLQYKF